MITEPLDGNDRLFNPARIPVSDEASDLVSEVILEVERYEADHGMRKRVRKARDQDRFVSTVTALTCDAIHREVTGPGMWLAVPLSKSKLGSNSDVPHILNEVFPDIVKRLAAEELGLLELRLGHKAQLGGRLSTVRAGPRLRSRIESLSLDDLTCDPSLMGDPIVLRGTKFAGKAKTLSYDDTDQTRRYRQDMQRINAWLAKADITCLDATLDDKIIDTGNRFLKRVFNKACFNLGGRLYGGFWQSSMTASARLQAIRIDGRPVTSLDFGQTAVRLAYGEIGAALPPGDQYAIAGYPRAGIKKILVALLSADTPLTRFPSGTRSLFRKGTKFVDVVDSIRRRHEPIAPLFGSGFGRRAQFADSELMIDILLQLIDREVVALPVHDSVIVADDDEDIAREVMMTCFRSRVGVDAEVMVEHANR
ncbi:MAG: hypothetical protein JNN30_18225 [Rhodanobacteraceae bacterium]|nr:hypothetical protein [Rhodanobacteraceae bacterium]